MKKRLFVALAIALAALIPAAACAAITGATDAAFADRTSAADMGFTDVFADADYAQAADWCREQGLMKGVGGGRFDPDGTLTRAMAVAVLYRAEQTPQTEWKDVFSDVPAGQWYSDAIAWASANDIVGGYGDGLFGVNDPVAKEQLDVIIRRYQGEKPAWTGDPALNVPAVRAQAAAAFYDALTATEAPEETGGKVLVAYFSRYGNTDYGETLDATTSASIVAEEDGALRGATERMARIIAEATGGDLRLIETAENYPANFDDVVDQNHKELAAGTRPALTSEADFENYDVIFIGYPVWASNAPAPVLSFLESGDLSGKRVIPFCTHDGYGAGSSYSAIGRSSQGAAVEAGLALEAPAADARPAVERWLEDLGFPKQAAEPSKGETALRITIGDMELDGVLYDCDMARQLIDQLPQTVSMSNYGGREVYGGLDEPIAVEGEGQLRFEDADLFEIQPETPYTTEDLNWHDASTRATVEQNDPNARPAISGSVENMEDYDVIFLGYPIWWGTAPKIVHTFLESYDFGGKTIIPFCTSASSGYSDGAIRPLAPDALWQTGRRFSGGASQSTVKSWIDSLNLELAPQ